MTTRNFATLALATFGLAVFAANPSLALPTQMVHADTPECDFLFIPTDVHEIGDVQVFPSDEALFASDQRQSPVLPCPAQDNPNLPDVLVDIRNLSGKVWHEVWYVANEETNISNYDGEANDASFSPLREAFRIDNQISDPNGAHHPLLFESMTQDGIWEIGESWQFVLQDYTNSSNLSPAKIDSLGVGDASLNNGVVLSSGSIIAISRVPEPSSCLLAGAAAAAVLVSLRRRRF